MRTLVCLLALTLLVGGCGDPGATSEDEVSGGRDRGQADEDGEKDAAGDAGSDGAGGDDGAAGDAAGDGGAGDGGGSDAVLDAPPEKIVAEDGSYTIETGGQIDAYLAARYKGE